ncbi:hypothetical protein PG997_006988 [Apiospora hydei]|uniref:Uncharacterized protein n=1 Tax=Apiospora hydei TaxID=1337664 RepID=A0ABR1WRG3_9PEZI
MLHPINALTIYPGCAQIKSIVASLIDRRHQSQPHSPQKSSNTRSSSVSRRSRLLIRRRLRVLRKLPRKRRRRLRRVAEDIRSRLPALPSHRQPARPARVHLERHRREVPIRRPVDGDGADVPAVDHAALGHVVGLGRVVVALAARVELEPAEVARRCVGREEVAVEPDGVPARAEARLEARGGAALEQRHLLPRAVAGLGEVALAVDEGAVGGADGGAGGGMGAPVQQVRLEAPRRRPAAEHVVAVGEIEGGLGQARRVVGQRAVQRRREGELGLDGRR